ncbi:hypothetical protein L6259_01845 [Candidatus Parcubacteria bacterium]|nr:hypothetical protein [Patescibacteria group bacterium]MCG2693997.1 hypothetical protein [Candidatus Parcubacteria bacterium]
MPRKKLPAKKIQWTPKLAYAIGLLVTDGCLSSDGRHIILRSSDIEQIETFKQCLGVYNKMEKTKHNGWAKRPAYRIQVGDVGLYRWLLTIGLFPNKTYTIGKIIIPDKFFKDFLRGHLDGDGCVTTYQDSYNTFKNPKYIYTRLIMRFISASEEHMIWLRETTYRLSGIKGDLHEYKPKRDYQTTSMWQLKFMKKASMKLIPWIYYSKDVPCLQRKRIYAEKALSRILK